MNSIRRSALRAACSSSMAVAVPRQQVASLAMRLSKASNMRPAVALPLTRYFSQTARTAQEDKDAIESANGQSPITVGSESADGQSRSPTTIDSERTNQTSSSDTSASATDDANCIFIGNVTYDATDIHIQEAFGQYGEVTRVSIGRDPRGLSRGFAFVYFKDLAAAELAVQKADNSFWHGRRINVNMRKKSNEKRQRAPRVSDSTQDKQPTNSLYIGNIPFETSDADLNRLFRELDNVTDVRVAVDRNTGWPRGFAHADFTDAESAQKALDKLSDMTMGGRQLRVDFAAGRQHRNTTRENPGAED